MSAKHSAEETAVPDTAAGAAPQHGFFVRLYTGTGAFEVIGKRKLWYAVSGVIVGISLLAMLVRGFTFGIDFEGGTKFSMPVDGAKGQATTEQVETVYSETFGKPPETVVIVGNGPSATVQIRTETLDNADTEKLRAALFEAFEPKGSDGQPSRLAISDSAVSSTWGGQITQKALIALVVFLVLVTIYITVRYERYMAIAALAALFFDLIVTAGVYALVGFEVSPATVIGLLTILGFSIYDTVIVFDKVEENTDGFEHTTRRTFAEQANLAVNQTFMRSINTSLISALPIIALMVIAVWLLGVGTLQDLALVQLVGVLVGTYSSIYFATPLLVSLRERTELVSKHTKKVLRRRAAAVAKAGAGAEADTDDEDVAGDGAEDTDDAGDAVSTAAAPAPAARAPDKPSPGARPNRPNRPSGKRRP